MKLPPRGQNNKWVEKWYTHFLFLRILDFSDSYAREHLRDLPGVVPLLFFVFLRTSPMDQLTHSENMSGAS